MYANVVSVLLGQLSSVKYITATFFICNLSHWLYLHKLTHLAPDITGPNWLLYTETRPADNFPLFTNTRCSRTSKKTTEFLFNTIYKPRCNNSCQSIYYAWYCTGIHRLLRFFQSLIVSSFTLPYLFYIPVICLI